MSVYIITYDLSRPGRNYSELYSRIKSYGSWAKITESSWAISTPSTAVSIRDHLTPALDANDKILVGALGSSAWKGLDDEVSKWLKTNGNYIAK